MDLKPCHFCDQPALWQVMSSKWICRPAVAGWSLRKATGDRVAQVCEEHLVEILKNNNAYHLVYKLDVASRPDGIDWSQLIEKCHKRNLSFYPGKESFLGP